jgi:UTP--glucose-1-phosphate uridylyltransferase
LVLAPGTAESLFTPLKATLELAVVPRLRLSYIEQARPEGLGDAVLLAEPLVGENPFAVLLPDDVLREHAGGPAESGELKSMMEAFSGLDKAHLLAVKSVSRSKLPHCGAAKIGIEGAVPGVFPVRQLVEKPEPSHPISRSEKTLGIVGRYLLQPEVFHTLRAMKKQGILPLELTDALETLRKQNHDIFAFHLKADRQDIGEILEQAGRLIAGAS